MLYKVYSTYSRYICYINRDFSWFYSAVQSSDTPRVVMECTQNISSFLMMPRGVRLINLFKLLLLM